MQQKDPFVKGENLKKYLAPSFRKKILRTFSVATKRKAIIAVDSQK